MKVSELRSTQAFLAYLLLVSATATAASRPNILFIVSEDNGEHLGCYGERRVHTPHLDALAEGGVRYTRSYVPYSVCSPSRAAFLTGLYTRQTGHIGLATHRFSMYRDFETMPAYFQQAGYYTGFLGKTHVNPERLVEDYIDHRAIKSSNFGKTTSIETYADEARAVMQKAAEEMKPFLLIINYADAHRKFVGKSKNGFPTTTVEQPIAPFPWIGSDSPHLREELRDYFNCMNRLDEGVGMVLSKLDKAGARDNTLVVYISDHGADFPRGKGSIYENGTRIPMIVNFPKSFPEGKVENGMVSTIDILPTMLRAARLPAPDHLAGIALQDVDSGKVPPRKYIHTFTTGSSPNLLYMQFGIRDERYKLVYNPDRALNRLAESRYRNSKLPEDQHVQSFLYPPEYELFDLQEDPHEWKNLAGSAEHQGIQQRLLKAMQDFQHEIKDPFVSKENVATFIAEQKEYLHKPYKKAGFRWPHLDMFEEAQEAGDVPASSQIIFQQRDIPEGVPREGHAKDAKKYGYRIPSLLVTKKGSILAFTERRLGLHDHAQNDIVLKRSTDNGETWSDEIVAYEDGMNSINDPLTVQLENGRILLMFARFPYGRHARDAGWIKMADLGYDDPKSNVLTFVCHSDDDGQTWSKLEDISRQVKHPKLLNANTPGAMIQLTKGPHKGRIVTGLWGTLPIMKDGKRSREWQIVVAYSDHNGKTWKRTEPLKDESGKGFPNECQVAEAANGDLVLISRNQGGDAFRKKAISHDGGETWSPLNIDRGLPSVACMGSVIKGPVKEDGTWDLWASFPSNSGRKDGQIAVSQDNGNTWRITKVISGPFAYSALQVSPDQRSLLCLYESDGYKRETLLTIPFDELAEPVARKDASNVSASTPVFRADVDQVGKHRYTNYREPVVVRTKSGRLIIGAQAGNRLGWPERSGQDLVVRMSDDDGKTWSPIVVAAEQADYSCQCHGLVYDAEINRVLFLYTVYNWDYTAVRNGRGAKFTKPVYERLANDGKPFVTSYRVHSDDEGRTWSKPVDITKQVGRQAHFGASEGRQLTTGRHKGRLLIAGSRMELDGSGNTVAKHPGVWRSDDHGESWSLALISMDPKLATPRNASSEARITELADGRLLYNERTRNTGRHVSWSKDGGETWTTTRQAADLKVTQCNGCTITLRDVSGQLTDSVLFSIPSPGGRADGVVFASNDGGETWPIRRDVVAGFFGYSALLQLNADTVGLFYEANHYKDIRFVALPVEPITPASNRAKVER